MIAHQVSLSVGLSEPNVDVFEAVNFANRPENTVGGTIKAAMANYVPETKILIRATVKAVDLGAFALADVVAPEPSANALARDKLIINPRGFLLGGKAPVLPANNKGGVDIALNGSYAGEAETAILPKIFVLSANLFANEFGGVVRDSAVHYLVLSEKPT